MKSCFNILKSIEACFKAIQLEIWGECPLLSRFYVQVHSPPLPSHTYRHTLHRCTGVARPSGAPKPIIVFGVHFRLGSPGPSGPLDIVHPVRPLATPLSTHLLRPWTLSTHLLRPCSHTYRLTLLRCTGVARPSGAQVRGPPNQ